MTTCRPAGAINDPRPGPHPAVIVVDHLRLVRSIASRIHVSLPVRFELEELVHTGMLGLIYAADQYVAEERVGFSTYAKHCIRGAILDGLRKNL
jgi:RNA polymerase sigma factor for flagellar operon FliA